MIFVDWISMNLGAPASRTQTFLSALQDASAPRLRRKVFNDPMLSAAAGPCSCKPWFC